MQQQKQSNKSPNQPQPQPQKTLLQQTLQQIQNRVIYFSTHNISAQNSLNQSNNISIRSISQIITPLKYFDIAQTPLSMGLNMIYSNQQNKNNLKWTIPPASQGQDSINQQQVFQPSFKWLTSVFIDPHLLQIDQIQPKRIQKGKIPQQWTGITTLLITKISKKIYEKKQIQQYEQMIKRKFTQRYTWLKFKRIKQIYYKGKPALMLKFGDANSASFVYYSLATFKSNRDEFGQQCQLFRIVKDQTKQYNKQKNWILLIFRHLPLTMTKQLLLSTINVNGQVKWMEELIQIEGAKYTFCKVSYLDDALHVCQLFNSKKIKDAKVNIHPKCSKNWKAQQVVHQQLQNIQQNVRIQNQKLSNTFQQSY